MSNAPDSLIDVRQQIAAHVEGERKFYTIRGFVGAKRTASYHLGAKDIVEDGLGFWRWDPDKDDWVGDYSTRRRRDKAGLAKNEDGGWTNWASAIDISANPALPKSELKRLLAWMVAEAKAGRLDAQELIGPNENGDATDYRRPFFKPIVRKDPDQNDSHREHIHWSLPRDISNPGVATYRADLWPMLAGFFGPRIDLAPQPEPQPEPEPEPEPEPPPPTTEELQAEIDLLEAEIADLRPRLAGAQEALGHAEASRQRLRSGVSAFLSGVDPFTRSLAARLSEES